MSEFASHGVRGSVVYRRNGALLDLLSK